MLQHCQFPPPDAFASGAAAWAGDSQLVVAGQSYGNGTYAASASSQEPGRPAAAAFDAAVPAGWRAAQPGPAWLQLRLPHALRLRSYAIDVSDADPQEAPAAWRLLGSDDGGASWPHVLGEGPPLQPAEWQQQPRRVLGVAAAPMCNAFRLEVPGAAGGAQRAPAVADVQLFGDPTRAAGDGADTLATSMLSLRQVALALAAGDEPAPTGEPLARHSLGAFYADGAKWDLADLPARGDGRPLSMGFFRGKSLHIAPLFAREYPPAPLTAATSQLAGRGTFGAAASAYAPGTPDNPPHRLFDGDPARRLHLARPDSGLYSAATGAYAGSSRVAYRTPAGEPRVAAGEWAQLRVPVPVQALRYTLTAPRAELMPASLLLLGSADADDDGAGWDLLDARADVAPAERRVFYVAPLPRAYRALRLVVVALQPAAAGALELSELRFACADHAGVPDAQGAAVSASGARQGLTHLATGARLVEAPLHVELGAGSTLRLLRSVGPSAAHTLLLRGPGTFDLSQHAVAGAAALGTTWAGYAQAYDLWRDLPQPDPPLMAHDSGLLRAFMFADAAADADVDASGAPGAALVDAGAAAGGRGGAFDTGTGPASEGLRIAAPEALQLGGGGAASLSVVGWARLVDPPPAQPAAAWRVGLLALREGDRALAGLWLESPSDDGSSGAPRAVARLNAAEGAADPHATAETRDALPMPPPGTWAQLGLVYDAPARTLTLYRNGVQAALPVAVPPSADPRAALFAAGDRSLAVGEAGGGARAQLDNVRLYGRALAPRELKALYDFEKHSPGF